MKFAALLLLPAAVIAAAQETRSLSETELRDKIKGAWAGQMIGVTVGWPTEFRALGKMYTDPVEWDPAKIYEALDQDDLYVEMTFCKVLDDEGVDAPAAAFGRAFAESKYQLWHANFKGRQNLIVGVEPPLSGHPDYNIHADDIDFQIESDFIGLMCPGMPNAAAAFAERIGSVMNYGDGVYGGVLMAAMYSAAFFETDVRAVVEAGMAAVPKESEFYEALRFAFDAYEKHPNDLPAAWQAYEDVWANTDNCSAGALHPFDIDAKTNAAYVVLGLLYGDGDFRRTVEASIECGQDSDCNPASALGILGAMNGYGWLPENWRRELESIGDKKFSFTAYSFNTIVDSSLAHAKTVIVANGGAVDGDSLTVALQEPAPVALVQWKQDEPVARIGADNGALVYEGEWTETAGRMESAKTGDTVTLRFTGTGAIVLGRYGKDCGIAAIAVDGKPVREVNLYYDWAAYGQEPFYGESLFHVFGLPHGDHTITVTVTGKSFGAASGAAIGIEGAVLYDGPEKRR